MQEAFERAAKQSGSPLAREILETQQQRRRFEGAQQTSDSVGHDFYLLTCLPVAAALTGLKKEALNEKWQSLRVQLQTFTPDEQTDLVEHIALGMGITEERVDPLYKQVFGVEGPLENSDYFVTAMSLLCGYNSGQREAFYNVMTTRQRSEGKQFPAACRA